MKTRKTTPPEVRTSAFTVIELLAVMLCLAVLAGLLLPAGSHPTKAYRAQCQNNLKQIGLAYRTWEGDYGDRYPMCVPTNQHGSMEYSAGSGMFHHYQVMSNEINNPKILVCPSDKRKEAADFEKINNSNLSYFVGLDADEQFPSFILSGDRNLMTNGVAVGPGLVAITSNQPVAWSKQMHNLCGNIGLADGSVQQTSSASLASLFQQTHTNVTRLAVP